MSVGVPSLRVLLAEARRLGMAVYTDSGDVIVVPPQGPKMRINNRRKDGTPSLAKLIRQAGGRV